MSCSPQLRAARGRLPACWLGVVVVAASAFGGALADQARDLERRPSPAATSGVERPAGPSLLRVRADAAGRWSDDSRRFYRVHLLPRVTRHLDGVSQIDLASGALRPFRDDVFSSDVIATTRRSVERATRKAIKSYLLEETSFSQVIGFFKERVARDRERASSARRASVPAFDVGFAGGQPRLLLRRALENGSLRLRLGARGTLGLEYNRLRRSATSVAAEYDLRDGRYGVSCLVSF